MVGMAGFFAGIAKVPIASLIMVAEMTGSYGLLVPTMLVAAVAVLITGKTTIYEMQVANRAESPAHRGEFILSILEKMRVRSCMIPPEQHQLIKENMLLKDLISLATRTSLHSFFLVDGNQRLLGVIALDDLRRIMLEAHLGSILVAKDLAVPPPPGVSPDDSLSVALERLVQNSLDEIPVLEGNNGTIAGLVRKKDLVVVYTQALAEEQERLNQTY
jgi:CIC family chloride channel protein